MNDTAEALMAEVRVRLGQAALCERRGECELADAYGAVAGNKMARAYRWAYPVHVRPATHMTGADYAEIYGENDP